MSVKLSVIVPCFNLKDYIIPCVESLLSQACSFTFEILVADDASTDGSRELLQQLAMSVGRSQLKVIAHENNQGLTQNLRGLLALAKGDYIAYLDGDDLALPGKLQMQVDFLDGNPGCGICYHESEVFDSATGKTLSLYSRDFYNARYVPRSAGLKDLVLYGTFLQASSVMFRRHTQLFEVLDPECRIIVDYPMHVANAALGGGSIDRIDEVLGRYRIHSSSFGAQTSRSAERREAVLKELLHTCERAGLLGLNKEYVARGKAHFRFATALYFLRAGDIPRFQRYIAESGKYGLFFDERHEFAFANKEAPDRLRQRFFGEMKA